MLLKTNKLPIKKFLTILSIMLLSFSISIPVYGHGGGLDSDGGHNCRVGDCAGTYHCHQPWGGACKAILGNGSKVNVNNDLKLNSNQSIFDINNQNRRAEKSRTICYKGTIKFTITGKNKKCPNGFIKK